MLAIGMGVTVAVENDELLAGLVPGEL